MFTSEQVNAFPGLAIEPVRPTTRPRPASLAPPIQQTLPLRFFFFTPCCNCFYPLLESLCVFTLCLNRCVLTNIVAQDTGWSHCGATGSHLNISQSDKEQASEFRQSSRKKARLSLFFVSDCVPGEARSPSSVHPFRALSQCRSSSPQVQVIEKPAFPAS